jgi:hypothetical protein
MQYGERFSADLDLISEAHSLSARQRFNLARIVSGAAQGNRDRGLFLLARNLVAAGSQDLLKLLLPGAAGLRREETALLDFLVTMALDSVEGVETLIASFQAALAAPDPARAFVPALIRVFHAYRSRVLPESRHHNVFTAIRRYFSVCRPEDPTPRNGDAPGFWEAEGRRDFLARYVTALRALADYAEAIRLAETWSDPVALDHPSAEALPAPDPESEASADTDYREQLADGLEILRKGRIKLLLSHELETLAGFAEYADLVQRWPNDVLAALIMGPVQNAITQALRQRSGGADFVQLTFDAPTSQQILNQLASLAGALSACLQVIHRSSRQSSQTASARSSLTLVEQRRIAAMERRQGFIDVPAETRAEVLTDLIEPVLVLKAVLERYQRAFIKLGPERCIELELEYKAVFGRKFESLYGATHEG